MIWLGNQSIGIGSQAAFNPLKFAYSCYYMFGTRENLPETMTLDFEGNTNLVSLYRTFYQAHGVKKLIIRNLKSPDSGINLYQAFNDNTLEEIHFINSTIKPSSTARTFSGNSIRSVYGPIDLSLISGSYNDMDYYARALSHIEIVPNTLFIPLSNSGHTTYDDTTLISIANGMNATVTKTQGFFASEKARLNAIIGDNVGGMFVQKENGTMTLADFITNVKGWTIA